MARRPLALAVPLALAAVLAAVAGCNADGAGSPGPGDLDVDLRTGARVEVSDEGMAPDEVTVTAGEMVAFVNVGDEDHRVVGEDTLFDSGDIRPGETFLFLFEEPGRVGYRDRHGAGSGTVEVTAAAER